VQRLQNDFARFASDVQALKAEIISKHFDPQTIVERSNIQFMVGPDQQLAQQAVALIKSDFYQYRIEVKPESVNMADMAAIKQERSEFLMAISQFFQSCLPVFQAAPWSTPFLLQTLQWAIAGFRGGSTIEGVMDQMVLAANQAAKQAAMQPPQPDPEMVKMQAQMQMEKQKGQIDIFGKVADLKVKQEAAKMDLMKKAMELKLQGQKNQMDLQQAAQESQIDQEMNVRKMEHEIQRDALKTAQVEKQSKEKADE